MRLIDADKLKEHIDKLPALPDGTFAGTHRNLKALINMQPNVKLANSEWVDFLSEQFTVSRTSAREMLHGMMRWKAEDNFKKQYSGGVGMKYIIEIPDKADFVTAVYIEDGLPVAYKSDRIDDLEPYTEPDRKVIEDEAWEFIRTLTRMTCKDSKTVYGENVLNFLQKVSYQEAKAKYDAWKRQKGEIRVEQN